MGSGQPGQREGDMGGWLTSLLVEFLVEGTICTLAFYYIGYTLSGRVIMHSEIIITWPLSVCVCVCVCVCIRGPVHEFMHGWGLASLARGRGHGQLASWPTG